MPLRLIFMGTPDFAVPTLRALHDYGHRIVAAYTREARPAGRGLQSQRTPVQIEAERLNIPLFAPKTLKGPEAEATFRSHEADAAVVVAYGMILPQGILDIPPRGCFNLHASLLPKWRGAAPIERAVIEGDNRTGVMVMKMDVGLDTGDIALEALAEITETTTAGDLRDTLAKIGAELMVRAMDNLEHNKLDLKRQESAWTYAAKLDKNDARIDWSLPAHRVLRHVHGYSPSPGAWCEMPIGGQIVRVKILRCEPASGEGFPGQLLDDRLTIACGQGAVRILELQRAGKGPMSAGVFLAGARLRPPLRLH
jgi:methionyl-tRNA formyltransferase